MKISDTLKLRLSEFDITKPYVWELRLNQSEFEELESCLKDSIYQQGGSNAHLLSSVYSIYAVIYIAEWYKRKYEDGNQQQDLFSPDDIQTLWKNSGIDTDKYVYLSDVDGSHRWVDSMNVLGGLPLKMSQNDKSLLKQLFEVYLKDKDSADIKSSNKSIASRKSILCHHSLFDYYHEVSLGRWPFDEDEVNDKNSDVARFILLAEEAHKPLLRDKVDFEWKVIHFDDYPTMSRSLLFCLKPEEAGDMHSYIWLRRVNCWGIEHPEQMGQLRFGVRFCKGKNVIQEVGYEDPVLVFWNSGDDETGFVKFGESRILEYDNVPTESFDKIELVVFDENQKALTIKTVETDKFIEYVQLFREDEGEWTSLRTAQSGQKESALLYSNACSVDSDLTIHKPFKNDKTQLTSEPYGWVKIEDEVTLHKGNVRETFYNLNGYDKLEVNQYENIIESHNVITDNEAAENNVPLLFRRTDILVKHYAGQNDTEADFDTTIQKLEWRPIGKARFSEWTEANPAEYGAIDVRVTVKGRYLGNKVYPFYYLPGVDAETPIFRDFENGVIRYADVDGEHDVAALPEQMKNGTPLSATHKITITCGQDFVELNVYRPTLIKEVYVDDKIVRYLHDGETLNLPYILKSRTKICDFNKNSGYLEYDCNRLTGYFANLQHGAKSDWMTNTRTGRVDNVIPASNLDENAPDYLTVCLGQDNLAAKNGVTLLSWDYSESYSPMSVTNIEETSSPLVFQSLKQIDKELTCMPPKQGEVAVAASIFGAFAAGAVSANEESLSSCFDVAVENKTYFFIFQPLAKIKESNFKTDFLSIYLQEKGMNIKELSLLQKSGILRFAEEVGYEWDANDTDYIELIKN